MECKVTINLLISLFSDLIISTKLTRSHFVYFLQAPFLLHVSIQPMQYNNTRCYSYILSDHVDCQTGSLLSWLASPVVESLQKGTK